MKVGLNSALNCQPMRFLQKEQSVPQKNPNNTTAFRSTTSDRQAMSINEKYELAKEIIAAQDMVISSLQRQLKTGLPASNLLNKFA